MDNMDLGFISRNYAKNFTLGKLKLPIPFVLEYGDSMPSKLSIQMPSGDIWFGKYVSGQYYIKGLENLMSFYGVRPYHIAVFNYHGGGDFKLQIFNECGVEIFYPFSTTSMDNHRVQRKDPFLVVGKMKLSNIEIDKLLSTSAYSTVYNFVGFYDIVIAKKDLSCQSTYEMMSLSDFDKFGLEETKKKIKICLEHYSWEICLGSKNGFLTFDRTWYQFVKATNVCEGDVCVFQRTATVDVFQIAVLPEYLLRQWSSKPDIRSGYQRFSWLKKLKGSCLQTGKVEMPRLFGMKFGTELGNQIQFKSSDGKVFQGRYKFSKNAVYGLENLIRSYDVYHNCVMVFEYVGLSTFNVSIFNSQNMDQLKDVTGEYVADIVKELEMQDTEAGIVNEHQNEESSVKVENTDKDMDKEDDLMEIEGVDVEQKIVASTDEIVLAGEENNSFVTILKKSHLDNKGHGVYCNTHCYDLYKEWKTGTVVTLSYRGKMYEVEVHRQKRSCRLGKGWNNFIHNSELKEGDNLQFRFNLPMNLEVAKLN